MLFLIYSLAQVHLGKSSGRDGLILNDFPEGQLFPEFLD